MDVKGMVSFSHIPELTTHKAQPLKAHVYFTSLAQSRGPMHKSAQTLFFVSDNVAVTPSAKKQKKAMIQDRQHQLLNRSHRKLALLQHDVQTQKKINGCIPNQLEPCSVRKFHKKPEKQKCESSRLQHPVNIHQIEALLQDDVVKCELSTEYKQYDYQGYYVDWESILYGGRQDLQNDLTCAAQGEVAKNSILPQITLHTDGQESVLSVEGILGVHAKFSDRFERVYPTEIANFLIRHLKPSNNGGKLNLLIANCCSASHSGVSNDAPTVQEAMTKRLKSQSYITGIRLTGSSADVGTANHRYSLRSADALVPKGCITT